METYEFGEKEEGVATREKRKDEQREDVGRRPGCFVVVVVVAVVGHRRLKRPGKSPESDARGRTGRRVALALLSSTLLANRAVPELVGPLAG